MVWVEMFLNIHVVLILFVDDDKMVLLLFRCKLIKGGLGFLYSYFEDEVIWWCRLLLCTEIKPSALTIL